MAGLEGTLSTPLGNIQKKYALIGGVVLVGVLGIAWYRSKKSAQASATAAAGESVGIDPATGYIYGSAEDAAALTNQGGYQFPQPSYGSGGGSSYPPGTTTGTGFASNGQWSQAAISYMQTNGLVEDASQLSAALGKYITGSPVTPTDVTLINQAIAVEGYPPVAGPNNYPPALNTGTTGGTTTPPATDARQGPPYPFDGTPGAPSFRVTANSNVDGWITSLQSHKVHVVWDDVARLNAGIANNIKNPQGPNGPHGANQFRAAAKYNLPSQEAWFK